MGTKEQRFEISCRDRTGQGVRRQRVVQEVLITIDGRVFCRCQKPNVHHLSCSHVIAACSVSGLDAVSYVSRYFTKKAAAQTWRHEIYGIGILGPFTQKNSHTMLIPDPAMKKGIGRRQTRRIQNGIDESDVGKKKKMLQLVWSRQSHLQVVPTAFSTHCCCRGWTFRESDGWIGSTYKNSPHLVVHVTACNVFVCTKLSILCICLEFGCNE